MQIGNKLKLQRNEAGLSQEELAKQLGVSRQTISNWETNRTYPDIGSVLKLSDLYGMSLDELLKEDSNMRKHTEEVAALPQKYWNYLFELAILLMPVGNLVIHWGATIPGIILYWGGALLLPSLWLARKKLFGMEEKNLRLVLIGWCMAVFGPLMRILTALFSGVEFGVAMAASNLFTSLLGIAGLLLIYAYGIFLEKGPRYYLVLFLYFGIPLYIFGSTMISGISSTGAFNRVNPFDAVYSIDQVTYGETPEQQPVISLTLNNHLKLDNAVIGTFSYVEPVDGQPKELAGTWQLIPDGEPTQRYKLDVTAQEDVTLSFFEDDQLQWRWELCRMPQMRVSVTTGSTINYAATWFQAGSWIGQVEEMPADQILSEEASTQLVFEEAMPEEITLVLEHHYGQQVDAKTYTLTRAGDKAFPIPDAIGPEHPGQEEYLVYRVAWGRGEYVFVLWLDEEPYYERAE